MQNPEWDRGFGDIWLPLNLLCEQVKLTLTKRSNV
jgi:hypothetical protein